MTIDGNRTTTSLSTPVAAIGDHFEHVKVESIKCKGTDLPVTIINPLPVANTECASSKSSDTSVKSGMDKVCTAKDLLIGVLKQQLKDSEDRYISETEFNSSAAKVTGSKILLIVLFFIFLNIGPSLANDIPKSNDTFSTFLTDVVGDTLLLKPVTQAKIINLVNNTKSKKYKDHDDIDMCLLIVKKLI